MERIELAASSRTVVRKRIKNLRHESIIPGVLYGSHIDSKLLQFDEKELTLTLRKAGMALINLKVDDAPGTLVLARELQRDVLTRRLLHVDFMAIQMTQEVNIEIPVILVGELDGEGMLLVGASSVEIQALPDKLISSIQLDVSELQLGDRLHVSDLEMPEGVELLTSLQEILVSVAHETVLEPEVEEEDLEEVTGEVERIGEKEASEEEEEKLRF